MATRLEERHSHEVEVLHQKPSMEDGVDDGDVYKPAPVGSFVRGDSRPSSGGGGFTSRLSTAIRRSLRLKSRTSAGRPSAEQPTVGVNKVDDLTKHARKHETFTEFADVAKYPCDRQWTTAEELEGVIRLNRKSQALSDCLRRFQPEFVDLVHLEVNAHFERLVGVALEG
uniref:BLOC-1-related complex subunit 5 n=1 Tax=Steinernema glaseri TaxID=37863 RepID=A0A1I7YMM0_9BILA